MLEGIITSSWFQTVVPWVLLLWSLAWELFAMWKAAKKNHFIWFILIFVVQLLGYLSIVFTIFGTLAALPILYIFVFSRLSFKDNKLYFEKWKKKSSKKK